MSFWLKKELFNKHNKLLCLGEGEGRNAIFFAKMVLKLQQLMLRFRIRKLQKKEQRKKN